MATTVIIVEDHLVVREGIKSILLRAGFQVQVEASDGEQAIDAVQNHPCDILILDLALPRRGGLDVLQQIRAERPRLPILVLSFWPEEDYALNALRAGATGYLTKDCTPSTLIAAVNKLVRGGRYISSGMAERLAIATTSSAAKQRFSSRETQVLHLLGSGKTVGEIGVELGLSLKTVSTYRTRLLEKIQLRNTNQLVRYAVKHDL